MKPEMVIDKKDLEPFMDLLLHQVGIECREESMLLLEDALKCRLRENGMDSLKNYYKFLQTPQGKTEELQEFINLITIQETHFFRNPSYFNALRDVVLPGLIQKKAGGRNHKTYFRPSLFIWSAGCSTGEEPYTIAMVVQDVIPDISGWDIQIAGTDISTFALDKARKGVYGKKSVHPMPRKYLDLYFDHPLEEPRKKSHVFREETFALKNEIKNLVTFQRHNLTRDPFFKHVDIIFCRNVLIYFKKDIVRRIFEQFHHALNPGGILILGHSESLHGMGLPFQLVGLQEAFLYKKTEQKEAQKPKTKTPMPQHPFRLKPVSAPEPPEPVVDMSLGLMREAEQLFSQKSYARAIVLCKKLLSQNPSLYPAHALLGKISANQGKTEEALHHLNYAVQVNPLSPEPYFILGTIYAKKEALEDAITYFKKTIYLDFKFPLAHFYLASLYKEKGFKKEALRAYRNTLETLNLAKEEEVAQWTSGYTKSMVQDICTRLIETLKG